MQRESGLTKLQRAISPRLATLHAARRWRSLRPLPPDAVDVIDLTHNDYLGLRRDADFQTRVHAAAAAWPLGAGASRLLGGEHAIYRELETRFANWKGAESALYFTSGYAANEALMQAVQQEGSVFFSDALNHASLVDGMRLARLHKEQKCIFPHNDLAALERSLKASTAPLKLIITESLFSMDGDRAPLFELSRLAERYEALMLIDEAHSLGVYGPKGAGLVAACGLSHDSLISVNPCGKALAAAGAFIAGPAWFRDYLINTARGFIFSTGPSPWVAAALHAAIPIIQELEAKRTALQQSSLALRSIMRELDLDSGTSDSHIIPLIVGSERAALFAESFLEARSVYTRAIRPPTVAANSCRLRLSLHAELDSTALDHIRIALKELRHALS